MNGKDALKDAIATHALKNRGLVIADSELSESANALLSFFQLLAEADQKVMKNERDKRNPDHSDQA